MLFKYHFTSIYYSTACENFTRVREIYAGGGPREYF